MMHYALVSRDDTSSQQIAKQIKDQLAAHQFTYDPDFPKLVICVGGDGTFLRAVNHYLSIIENVSFIGVHTGTLGFFSDYSMDDINTLIDDIVNKQPTYHTKRLLEIDVHGPLKQKFYAINEARIENIIQTQIIQVFINDQLFETFRGTGLCISTQAGSTAYNRSLGGAVIFNDLELLQLTEITGIHHHLYRSLQVPMILNANAKITLKSDSFENAMLCYDTHALSLKDSQHVDCYLSQRVVTFAKYHQDNYFKKITHLF